MPDDTPRKYYPCEHCDAIRATEEGLETHVELKHSEHA